MLSVFLTIWLLLQLPVALALGRFCACPSIAPRVMGVADRRVAYRARAA